MSTTANDGADVTAQVMAARLIIILMNDSRDSGILIAQDAEETDT